MKKIATLLIAILISQTSFSQSFKDLIKKYEKDCNTIVKDTIKQYGTITETLVKVKTSNYFQVKLDTVWNKPNCAEYKESQNIQFNNGSVIWNNSFSSTTGLNVGYIIGAEKAENKTRAISRDYICNIKKRKIQPFSEHFWNWIKEN